MIRALPRLSLLQAPAFTLHGRSLSLRSRREHKGKEGNGAAIETFRRNGIEWGKRPGKRTRHASGWKKRKLGNANQETKIQRHAFARFPFHKRHPLWFLLSPRACFGRKENSATRAKSIGKNGTNKGCKALALRISGASSQKNYWRGYLVKWFCHYFELHARVVMLFYTP